MIIEDPAIIRSILKTLDSGHAVLILVRALRGIVSAPELLQELNIPSSTLYRYLKELEDTGLIVRVKSGRTPDGHWFETYCGVVSEIRFRLGAEGLTMELTSVEDMPSRLLKLWKPMERR